MICTLGNFSTKLLRGDPTGISRLHGQAEILVIGARAVRLYPLFHPAAALYTRSLLETLQADFARLPALLALDPPEQPEPAAPPEPAVPAPALAEPEPRRPSRSWRSRNRRASRSGPPCSSPPRASPSPTDDDRQLGLF